ncbi:low affinity iron permease family protein [Phenylobacterium sp.]|uniref:low affinity iron permease family protein n=1 Tax=Phenylobacterium sp. TaxID=1871053 RepID=UPI003983D6C0
MDFNRSFSNFASKTARVSGSPVTFGLCILLVLAWASTGPIFKFSQTWQLVINTGTTIITFLMVFLIQNTQNRDGMAIQTKLDELILTSNAEDEFVGIEHLTDRELSALQARLATAAQAHARLAAAAQKEIGSRKTDAAS